MDSCRQHSDKVRLIEHHQQCHSRLILDASMSWLKVAMIDIDREQLIYHNVE